jgi:hypothetical protein
MALVFAYDCVGRPAPGVTFTLTKLDTSAYIYYWSAHRASRGAVT